jgi:anti-sigma regulatory factor (Ser/Thr protein kinase)
MGLSRLRIQLTLVPSPEASRQARKFLETVPDLAPYPDLLFTAQLLTHELLMNSVHHGELAHWHTVKLTAESDNETLSVQVVHRGSGFDALAALSEHYRRRELYHGLFLIDALADRWGYTRQGGCTLSFDLDLVPGRRPWHGRKPSPSFHRENPA